jgi:hypothetical protein
MTVTQHNANPEISKLVFLFTQDDHGQHAQQGADRDRVQARNQGDGRGRQGDARCAPRDVPLLGSEQNPRIKNSNKKLLVFFCDFEKKKKKKKKKREGKTMSENQLAGFIVKLRRREVKGSYSCARETAEIMRKVIGACSKVLGAAPAAHASVIHCCSQSIPNRRKKKKKKKRTNDKKKTTPSPHWANRFPPNKTIANYPCLGKQLQPRTCA